ncbi:MAG: haloalkane dehalogenase [Micropepsaceae bacterium]
MKILRTPDDRFAGLKDFPFEPHYLTVGEGLRLHYVDEGPRDAPPVLMLHGEPTWSYLYRHMIPRVASAGLRAIAPDLIGFGRSDKPSAVADHTYARQVAWMRECIEALDLKDITLVCQDWGSLIGLRLAAENEFRFSRIILSNGGLPLGEGVFSPAFGIWKAFATHSPVLPISRIIWAGSQFKLDAQERAAYEAPYPSSAYKAAPRVYPSLVPVRPDNPARTDNLAAWKILGNWTKPFICCFSDGDPITRGLDKLVLEHVPGARGQPHVMLKGGHFIQENDPDGFSGVIVRALGR